MRTKLNFDLESIRSDFPILGKQINEKPIVYLDNAATTQKPLSVIEKVRDFEMHSYATVRRGAYRLGEEATSLYEGVRESIAKFIGANDKRQIIFTSGTTQSINLIAYSFGKRFVNEGDEVIISEMEHHANIIPWQVMCKDRGAKLKVIPFNDKGELIMEEYEKLLSSKTKLVCVTHVSNALGTINPIEKIIEKAHGSGAFVVIDGAQSVPHMKVDVSMLDCDFYVFSAHKMYGPSGVGVLYGKSSLLDDMPPYVTGGEMVNKVSFDGTSFAPVPAKFEAGTPAISQVIGFGEAIVYITKLGLDNIAAYEHELLEYATAIFDKEFKDDIRIIGRAADKAGILSFELKGTHPHDIITLLDEDNIALRGGHHCAQPTMRHFNLAATTRASFSFYNSYKEIDKLAFSLKKVIKVFS